MRQSRDRGSPGRRSSQVRGQSPSYRSQNGHVTQQEVPGNLAHQIQSVIRGELRRMMEVK